MQSRAATARNSFMSLSVRFYCSFKVVFLLLVLQRKCTDEVLEPGAALAPAGYRLLLRYKPDTDPFVQRARKWLSQQPRVAGGKDGTDQPLVNGTDVPLSTLFKAASEAKVAQAGGWFAAGSDDLLPMSAGVLAPAPAAVRGGIAGIAGAVSAVLPSASGAVGALQDGVWELRDALRRTVQRFAYAASSRTFVLETGSEDELQALLTFFRSDALGGAIEMVAEDGLVAIMDLPSYVHPAGPPDDVFFSKQWHLPRMRASGNDTHLGAWNVTVGNAGIIVAIIDSGVDWRHPDLAGNIWTNTNEIPDNGIDDDQNGFVDDVRGWDWVEGDNDPSDTLGHGTHCAGLVGAIANNGRGVAGVSPVVTLLPLRVMDGNGSGTYSSIIMALDYAVEVGAHISSNSYGAAIMDAVLTQAVQAAADAGQLIIAAVGNSAINVDRRPMYPACLPIDSIMSVGASTETDARSSYSNFGAINVDLMAPGDNILSTYPAKDGDPASYVFLSGTSMAGPQVAGAAALLLAALKDRGLPYTRQAVRIKRLLMQSADVSPRLAGSCVTSGRLNAARAMALMLNFTLPESSSSQGAGFTPPLPLSPDSNSSSPTAGNVTRGATVLDVPRPPPPSPQSSAWRAGTEQCWLVTLAIAAMMVVSWAGM